MLAIYRYVVRYDSGVAPRPFDGYCTLAICKPAIRSKARVGDWVIGFRSRAPGEVIYVMRVDEVLTFAQYWRDRRFRDRRPGMSTTPDNIYRLRRDGAVEQVRNHVHGDESAAVDLRGRNVLVSSRFWYFGEESPSIATDLVHLVHAGIGHAVNKNRREDDPDRLLQWLAAWPEGIHGKPVDKRWIDLPIDSTQGPRSCRPTGSGAQRPRSRASHARSC